MDLGLEGKTALVCGSSRGLGRAVAEELAQEGADLILCARDAEVLESTGREIRQQSGREVVAVSADLSTFEGIHKILSEARRDFDAVDILVNNAGGPPAGLFEQLSPESWQAAFRLTLESALNLTRAVLPDMKSRRWGRIINITSVAVKQPVKNLILSNSLRAAVTGFARTLADEVAPYQITVNNVLPGYTRTQRLDELADSMASQSGSSREQVNSQWEADIPLGRLGQPREFAALVAFLASERASYITGTSIPVDGGWIRAIF